MNKMYTVQANKCGDFLLGLLPTASIRRRGFTGRDGKWTILQDTLEHPKLGMRIKLSRSKLRSLCLEYLDHAYLYSRDNRVVNNSRALTETWRHMQNFLERNGYRCLVSNAVNKRGDAVEYPLAFKWYKAS